MNNIQTLNRNFEAITWGVLLIWWGITELVNALPEGAWAIGTGLILIGSNIVRSQSGIHTSSLTNTLGILALVWGGLEMAEAVLSLPFGLPVFAILLIVWGMIVLFNNLTARRIELTGGVK